MTVIDTLPDASMFRTLPLRGLPEGAGVDREQRLIRGAKAMEFGPLNLGDSRPWKVDGVTLQQLAKLVNDQSRGVKMRFAHPNMSRDGMGRHLGRASAAKIVGEGDAAYVAIDAQLSTTNKQYGDHVLDLAESYPEDFGLSIAPVLDSQAMGKIEPDENGLVPIRLQALRAIDFVDEPAATRGGLFSLDSDALPDLPARATDLLDTFFGDSPANVIRARFAEFLDTYLQNRGEPMATETPVVTKPEEAKQELSTQPAASDQAGQAAAKAELSRRSEIFALCKLANVSDENRDLMLAAGFSRSEAQDWLKQSGHLSANNPPVSEGTAKIEQPADPDAKFAAEWDENREVFDRMGVTKEQYIASRRK